MPLTFMVSPFGKANKSSPTSAAFRSICGVAILEIPDYNEVGDSIDQHRDMRLDIDHMSYEELLALGEQIGWVVRGSHYKPFEKKIVHFL
nr:uncharacterized protein LOC109163656 isoform X1 [Ipomoea trifida]